MAVLLLSNPLIAFAQSSSTTTTTTLVAVTTTTTLPPAPGPTPIATPPAETDPDTDGTLVPWEQAEQYIGKEVTITGRIADVHCSPLNCLLAFEPSFNRFTAVVPVNRFDIFPPDQLKESWKGKQVRVAGVVVANGKKPEIVVQTADALRISRGERRRERDQRRQDEADAQLEALDRLDDALARVEELTQRLTDSEARLENMLAALDQRISLLANLQTPVAPPTGVGEPHTWEAVRSIKRGMSATDVARLLGQPDSVEQSGGWEVWYYDGGRSISFDRRGRAQSLAGFPSR